MLRRPSFWERIAGLLRAPNLTTDELEVRSEVLSITESLCAALRESEVTDAVFLAVDGRTAYLDPLGVPNDLPLLLEAARAERLRGPFGEVRAVFTHLDAGVETLFEATVVRRFRPDRPVAILALSSRLKALRPQAGESLQQTRELLHGVLSDPAIIIAVRHQLEHLVSSLAGALRRLFPDGTVEPKPVTTFLVRPSRKAVVELSQRSLVNPEPSLRPQPRCYHRAASQSRYYDPWDCYYEDVGETWVDLAMLDECMEGAAPSPELLVLDIVDAAGAFLCGADRAAAHLADFAGVHAAAIGDYYSMGGPLPDTSYCWNGPSDLGGDLSLDVTDGVTDSFVDLVSAGASGHGELLSSMSETLDFKSNVVSTVIDFVGDTSIDFDSGD